MIEADAYLFDIDGTLLNVRDATHYFAFLNAMRDVFGVECNLDGVPVHGNSDVGILRAALQGQGIADGTFEQHIERAIKQMCSEVTRNAADIRAECCPSVRDFLEQLRQSGKLLGIVTGNLEPIGWIKLEKAGLREYFAFGCFSAMMGPAADEADNRHAMDRNRVGRNETTRNEMKRYERRAEIVACGVHEARQRLGSSARVCIVGDTPLDVEAARQSSIPVIAVATGTYSLEQLQAAYPDVCVASCQELVGN